jgi:probable Rubsico expression protein CbbX
VTAPQEPSGFRLHRPGGVPPAGNGGPPATDRSAVTSGAATGASEYLQAEDTIDLHNDSAAERVRSVLADLDASLVGLAGVKRRMREIAALLTVDRARAQFGLQASKPSLHMSFTGGPGTGKTTVALRMAEMLHALGYLRLPRVHAVTRDDLVGQFIGHTAPKTKEAMAKAAGGVLFIDEAYYLFRPENERDYGQEAIEILLQEMEADRGSIVVIFAGYEDRMEAFFSSNPGLSSRVAHHIAFEDYTRDELMAIAELMLERDRYRFDGPGAAAFAEYLDRRLRQPRFANARSVRNALERCRLRQANRLVGGVDGTVSLLDLMTLTEQDVRASRVFSSSPNADTPEPA